MFSSLGFGVNLGPRKFDSPWFGVARNRLGNRAIFLLSGLWASNRTSSPEKAWNTCRVARTARQNLHVLVLLFMLFVRAKTIRKPHGSFSWWVFGEQAQLEVEAPNNHGALMSVMTIKNHMMSKAIGNGLTNLKPDQKVQRFPPYFATCFLLLLQPGTNKLRATS